MVKIVSIFKEMLVLCKILQSFFSIFLFNLPSQCFTCITKRMMEMDGDGENCEYFQRNACAVQYTSIFLFNLPSQCCTCITKIMMEMDGDGENCEYFQRNARAV